MAISIRPATPYNVPVLGVIERAAGLLFADIGMPEIAADDPLPEGVFMEGVNDGRLWVAVGQGDDALPVAYLLAVILDESLHIEQLTVHPHYARQRIGSRLIDVCGDRATAWGYRSLTLTTFRDVPWNAPYYRRIGFMEVPDAQIPPALREIIRQEHDAGLDRWPRVVMRRALVR